METDKKRYRWTNERPDYGPSQVKDPKDLVIGCKYIRHYRDQDNVDITQAYTLVQSPTAEDPGYVDTLTMQVNGEHFEGRISLADAGVIPYPKDWPGQWQQDVWLEATTPRTEEELGEQITAIFETAYTKAGKTLLTASSLAERVLTIAERSVIENHKNTQNKIRHQIRRFDVETRTIKPR